MKSFTVFALFAFAAVAYALPRPGLKDLDDAEDAEIVSYENNRSDDNSQYRFHIETSDGVIKEESGKLVLSGKDDDGDDVWSFVVDGFYQYTGPDDHVYKTTYHSARDGFQAAGDHIPQVDHEAYDAALNEQARAVANQQRVAAEIEQKSTGVLRSGISQAVNQGPIAVPQAQQSSSTVVKTKKTTYKTYNN